MNRTLIGTTLLLALGLATAPTHAATPTKTTARKTVSKTTAKPSTGPQVVVLETAQGKIAIKLHEKDAPQTAGNFKKLVREKFYDGTYFHRVIPGFMIQGGDPNSKNTDIGDDGVGGPGYTVPAEIKLPHLRGSVATARQGDQANPARASSGSQFFIDVAPQPSLDRGGYTVFGEVISGMDVVDKIAAFGADPKTPQGASGPNPGKNALIVRATLEPASKWAKPAVEAAAAGTKVEMTTPATESPKPAAHDTSHKGHHH